MDAYVYQAALHCTACATAIKGRTARPAHVDEQDESSFDSDDWPKGPYAYGGGEADSPQHCDSCNVFFGNLLTEAGVAYVRSASRTPVSVMWRKFYALPERRPVGWTMAGIRQENTEKGGYFFSCDTMRAHGDTMRSFAVVNGGRPDSAGLVTFRRARASRGVAAGALYFFNPASGAIGSAPR